MRGEGRGGEEWAEHPSHPRMQAPSLDEWELWRQKGREYGCKTGQPPNTSRIYARKRRWSENLPSVVLRIQEEVRADNSDADCYDDENNEYQQHKPVDIIDFVSPERRENEVPINKSNLFFKLHFLEYDNVIFIQVSLVQWMISSTQDLSNIYIRW